VKAILVISARDNVATALEPLEAGRHLAVDGGTLTVAEPIPNGHKIALHPIAVGTPVVKYGSPIGLATEHIAAGTHVHTHNLSSSRGRGDLLESPPGQPQPRLAEPPDERNGVDLPLTTRSSG
jgi:SAF domain-containing protein